MDSTAAKLLQAAEQRGLSGPALARLIGVSPTAIWLLRKGKRGVGRDMRERAVRHFPELYSEFFPPIPDEAVPA